MKSLPIRLKITLWFAAALIMAVAFTFAAVLGVSNQVIQKTIRDNLITTVAHNVDEVEFFPTLADALLTNDVDVFLPFGDGFLEVDDDFLDEVNHVYTALYFQDGTFLYGENPIAAETATLAFADSQVQTLTVSGTAYYIFDLRLTARGLEGLWMRGVVSEEQGAKQMASIARTSLILMPAFVIVAIIGGYLIARRMLRPIAQISATAADIREGGDLRRRIKLGRGNDELHRLADNFNLMFDRLEAAFQAERRFTSDASHELRTPTAVILAQCELTLEEPRSPEEYAEALGVVQRQGRKMSRLIDDLLDFTRLERKTEHYALERVDLSALVGATCADMALLGERGIALRCDVEPRVLCRGNAELLGRALTNLLGNAYRYGKDGGNIWVTLAKGEGGILLAVRDDGIGIAKEEQERIFGRFYQASATYSGTGTGLGLAMVQEIAKYHSGTVRVESVLGEGSTFTLELPLL